MPSVKARAQRLASAVLASLYAGACLSCRNKHLGTCVMQDLQITHTVFVTCNGTPAHAICAATLPVRMQVLGHASKGIYMPHRTHAQQLTNPAKCFLHWHRARCAVCHRLCTRYAIRSSKQGHYSCTRTPADVSFAGGYDLDTCCCCCWLQTQVCKLSRNYGQTHD